MFWPTVLNIENGTRRTPRRGEGFENSGQALESVFVNGLVGVEVLRNSVWGSDTEVGDLLVLLACPDQTAAGQHHHQADASQPVMGGVALILIVAQASPQV